MRECIQNLIFLAFLDPELCLKTANEKSIFIDAYQMAGNSNKMSNLHIKYLDGMVLVIDLTVKVFQKLTELVIDKLIDFNCSE